MQPPIDFKPYTNCPKCGADLKVFGYQINGTGQRRCRPCSTKRAQVAAKVNQKKSSY